MPTPSPIATKYAEALQEKFSTFTVGESNYNPGYTFTVEAGGKYDRIVEASGGQRHVHAFVVRATGGLVKSATWKAPQREKDGLAVRYVLSVEDEFTAAIEDADPYGAYLYAGARTIRPIN